MNTLDTAGDKSKRKDTTVLIIKVLRIQSNVCNKRNSA